MFSAEDVLARTRRQPFQPFRIVTTTGAEFPVFHPDQALVTRRFVTLPAPPPDGGMPESVSSVAIIHVVELRDEMPPVQPPPQEEATSDIG